MGQASLRVKAFSIRMNELVADRPLMDGGLWPSPEFQRVASLWPTRCYCQHENLTFSQGGHFSVAIVTFLMLMASMFFLKRHPRLLIAVGVLVSLCNSAPVLHAGLVDSITFGDTTSESTHQFQDAGSEVGQGGLAFLEGGYDELHAQGRSLGPQLRHGPVLGLGYHRRPAHAFLRGKTDRVVSPRGRRTARRGQ
jgi:hypothetical protein